MSRETSVPFTPKELAALLRRTPKWVAGQCRKGGIPTLPPHRRPYLIPRSVLFPGSELVVSNGK